ncbi:putative Copper homeostasis protein cutC-like protein [Operophtera brumata]|uniref:Copper homeostasis protein cutC homolog n=1 Tax=Operophtera brumata TaxID=104452 RepID=A0A0L7LJH8_OPEBR|nr:putative Copper homeostasis protein cutC-like protein [Operophtera brumata]
MLQVAVDSLESAVRKQPANSRTQVNVTIRCRGGDDFLYSEFEMITMLRDVKYFKEMDVDGFVFGALTENLDIDEHKAMKVLAIASPKNVTFSRAFDHKMLQVAVDSLESAVRKQPANSRTQVNVTIRCRGGDDFLYSEFEMITMLRDVKYFKEMDVDGFVFGALTENLDIDEHKAMKVLAIASPKNVTFSRAFDHVREYKKTANILVGLGFHRVHTAGLRENVNQPGAIKNLSFLATRYNSSELSIMPGGGVSPDNVGCFINMGCNIIHSTCRSAMQLPKTERLFSLGVTDSSSVYLADVEVVKELKESIFQAVQERDKDIDEVDYQ